MIDISSAKSPLVIYHGSCRDGFAAAWVANRYFSRLCTAVEFLAGYYGVPAPDVTGRDVFILDFSYPLATMQKIQDTAKSLVVLDHHATAKDALKELESSDRSFVCFDMARSGAGMAWDYFEAITCTGKSRPRSWLINYVEDRDLWRKALPDSDLINAYIGVLPFDFSVWDEEHRLGFRSEVVDLGRAVSRKISQYIAEVSKNAIATRFDQWVVPLVNAPKCDISELLGSLLEVPYQAGTEPPKFVMGWQQRHDSRFEYSFRSKGDFDVSALARRYGGGGHKNAAGFESGRPLHLTGSFEAPASDWEF